ncbi:peroxidase family protein [Marivita sp.]|uniref:peroxidase family protein n=1 Tax=Marivita sp. TaxID=2003365 RepID=UPI0025BDA57A|nr:peroxidase family protein [Marivita sp.]
MVFVNTNDLKHILDQIRIAEQHVAGTPLTELVQNPLLPYGLRLVDGTLNNLTPGREDWGSADQVMPRLLESTFLTQAEGAHLADPNPRAPQDGPTSYTQTAGSVYDAEPRVISNLIADQTLSNPAVIAAALSHSGLTGQAMLTAANEIVQGYQRVIDAQAATGNVDQALELQRQELQSALDAASAELTAAQDDVAAKTTAKNDADQAVTQAQDTLDNAAATMVTLQGQGQVAEMQAALNTAVAAHTQADSDLKAAQDELTQAESAAASMLTMRNAKQNTVTNLQEQKATADQELLSAENILTAAQDALALETDAAGAVTSAQTAVEEATTAVSNAQTRVNALDAQLQQAQSDLDDLNVQLQTAQEAATAAQSRVTAAEVIAAETQTARDNAQSLFDTEVSELATAQSEMLSALNIYMSGGSLADFSLASAAYSTAREEKLAAEQALAAAINADEEADQDVATENTALSTAQSAVNTLTTQRDNAIITRDGLNAQLGDANGNLTTAQGTLTTAQQTLQTAQANNQAYVEAQNAATQAQADVDAAQGVVDGLVAQLGIVEAELTTLNNSLTMADNEVTRLEGVVQTETTDLATAAGNVTTAQQNLSAAQMADAAILAQLDVIADATVQLNQATATAAQAALDLTAAEGAVTAKRTAVDTATNDLAALTAPGAAEAALAAAQAVAAEAQTTLDTLLTTHDITMDGNNILLPDVTPDEGLSAPYNSWMTLFGQFFDHGLDLIGKGGSGTVYIPLQPDDPLYEEGSPTNFMVLTRATNQPGPDGILGTDDDVREHFNKTTPWVDQNQTYTSHPSHQVFLREYDFDANGNPVSNGFLLHGQTGGMSTWGDVKAQAATKLGIQLNDSDVLDGPLLATDPYGNFIPGPNGLPQLVVPNPDYVEGGTEPQHIHVEGNLTDPVDASQALRNGHAFLEDISHSAFPKGMIDHDRNPMTPEIEVAPDADTDTGNAIMPNMFGMNETYDNELLDRHFIAGDGRGNENFGLTAVHHVFHTEHNRQTTEMKQTILDSGELAFINEWLATPITEGELATATADSLDWDGGRLFQAAKFTTEMQYQHLAFEEFGRTVQPQIAAFGMNASAEIDGAVMAEFAHVVYRFGHSMLTENVQTMDPNGVNTSNGLIEAFLNPVAFDLDQTLTSDQAAGAVARGMSRETGANIDEFITSALRDNLVGLPLDLAALNIARGRETGVPSLNTAREQFYAATGSEFLKPYEGWSEFAANLKNPASIINFIASYGTHDTIVNATTVVEKRAAATDLVLGGDNAPADRLDFVNGTGAWADAETGINDVEFWIGGLAEDIMPFGGMLGSSFGFVFQQQMEALQNGDRFYYLARTAGMNMIAELENNSFASMIVRNTDIADGGAHIPANIFSSMDVILEVDQAVQSMPDPVSTDVDPFLAAMGTTMVERATATVDAPLIDGVREYDNFLKFNGGEHAVLGGTDQRDILNGGLGDDALWGGAGDDLLIGDAGVNTLRGGAGNDILKDGDDVSFLHGEDGDDVISAGGGIGELMFGGQGNDAILMGSDDAATAFGMDGNDFIYGGAGGEFMFGGEGDDWIEGGDGFDMVMGDNGDPFGGSRVVGHDVLDGGANDNDLLGEGGDDILIQREGVHVNEGDFGFDWVAHKNAMTGADIDLTRRLETNEALDAIRDRYNLIEAASGTQFDDFLYGDDREGAALPEGLDPLANDATLFANELTQAGVDRIDGLRELLADMMGVDPADTFTGGNILLGGGGNDVIQGRGGDDVIDGDKALNVRISVRDPQDPTVELRSINSLFEISNELLDGSVSPSQLQIVREILDAGQEGDVDTAVYFDVRANYNIRTNADGSVTVDHIAPPVEGAFIDPINGDPNVAGGDGTDRLTNVEILRFADMEIDLRTDPASNGLIQGTDGNDVLDASNGPDAIFAGAGDDVINGLAGNDVIFAEGGSDTITWNAPNGGYDVVVGHGIVDDGGTDMLVINGDGTEDAFTMYTAAAWTDQGGDAPVDPLSEIVITRTVAGLETAIMEVRGIEEVTLNGVQGVETITAVGDFAGTSLAPNTIYVNGTAGNEVIDFSGFTSTQRLVVDAGDGRDNITGGAGNDMLNAGADRDEISWNVGGGSDVVDGGAGEDTYTINGDASDETFRVYAADSWAGAPLATDTDIVITRDGGTGEQVIGQLQNIEEIQINTAGGTNDVQVIGDFNPTALNFNTISVTGEVANVDVTGRLSTHRVFVETESRATTVTGTLTEGDVIVVPVDIDPASLVATIDGTTVTQTSGDFSLTYTVDAADTVPVIVQSGTGLANSLRGVATINEQTGAPEGLGTVALGTLPRGNVLVTQDDIDALKYMVGASNVLPVLPPEPGEPVDNEPADLLQEVRDLEGLTNNLQNPEISGGATLPFARVTEARYAGTGEDGAGIVNPVFDGLDTRDISNVLGDQDPNAAKAATANMFMMSFGQYFDHGLTFIPKGTGPNGPLNQIEIGGRGMEMGPFSDNPADLTRGSVVDYDADGTPLHENITSPVVDQNQVYGSSNLVGQLLRESDGSGGVGSRIVSGMEDPSAPGKDLLPTLRELLNHHIDAGTVFAGTDIGDVTLLDYYPGLRDADGNFDAGIVSQLSGDFMGEGWPLLIDTNPFMNLLDHFVGGDGRANENVGLTAVHTVWARNHNYHVEQLEQVGFDGTPEELFQAARILNIGEYQQVVFNDFADSLLGGLQGSGRHGHDEYNPDADGRISHEFAAAAYRFGHSQIGEMMTLKNEAGEDVQVPLFDIFLNPTNDPSVFQADLDRDGTVDVTGAEALGALAGMGYTPQPGFAQYGVGNILSGLLGQPSEEVDLQVVDGVRNDLVRISADLFAFNAARGRDLGLGTLNQVKADLAASANPYVSEAIELSDMTMTPYADWADFQARNGLSDDMIAKFQQAYPDLVLAGDDIAAFQAVNPDIALTENGDGTMTVQGIDRVDLWVGGLAEQHIQDGVVGHTFWVLIHEQLDRLQEADRFYYIDRIGDLPVYNNFISNITMGDIVARNTGLTDVPLDAFSYNGEPAPEAPAVPQEPAPQEPAPQEPAPQEPAPQEPAPQEPSAAVDGIVESGTEVGDALVGAAGDDVLSGYEGNDMLVGNAGDDMLFGGDGRDDMLGGEGADMLVGGAGSDNILGGDGDDLIIGGSGSDILMGNAGDDTFIGTDGDCNDLIYGGEGSDTIDMASVTSDLTVRLGNAGTDRGSVTTAEGGRDTIWSIENFVGGAGDDTIFASDAANVLDGGDGNDTFVFETAASAQGDHINGLSAGDVLQFGTGADAVTISSRDQAIEAGFAVAHDAANDVSTISGSLDEEDFQLTVSGRFDYDQIA